MQMFLLSGEEYDDEFEISDASQNPLSWYLCVSWNIIEMCIEEFMKSETEMLLCPKGLFLLMLVQEWNNRNLSEGFSATGPLS